MANEKLCSRFSMYLKERLCLGRQMSHLSVKTKLGSFFKPALLHSKQVQFLRLLSVNKYNIFS
jgi:hypothetical protein